MCHLTRGCPVIPLFALLQSLTLSDGRGSRSALDSLELDNPTAVKELVYHILPKQAKNVETSQVHPIALDRMSWI